MAKCYRAVKKRRNTDVSYQQGQALETVRLSEDRLRGMCVLWLHFQFMSITDKSTETESRQ